MYEQVVKVSDKAGLPPGSLVYVGDGNDGKSQITCMVLEKDGVREFSIDDFEQVASNKDSHVVWLDVRGINSMENTGKAMDLFGLHMLVREDILDTSQRPKADFDGGKLFVVGKRFVKGDLGKLASEQVSFVFHGKCILTLQETLADSFASVRKRLSLINELDRDASYLFYALLDSVVDSYYVFIEDFGDQLEELEEEITINSNPTVLNKVRLLKNNLLVFRHNLWAIREVVHKMLNEAERVFSPPVLPYLRDVYDNIFQMWETVDMYRDMAGSAVDMYLSSNSNRMNEVIKVLTVISTIFIPITFIVGLYGMNFANMPELQWEYGYPVTLLVILLCVFTMLVYFKRKKWL